MTFTTTSKPNTIVYNDTIYNGSKKFKALFLRTGDYEIIKLYQQHQSNKVAGGILGTIGSIALILGVSEASKTDGNKTAGWIATGGGLVTAITGGYLTLVGQQKLMLATILFNKKYAKTTASIGFTGNGIGVVVKL